MLEEQEQQQLWSKATVNNWNDFSHCYNISSKLNQRNQADTRQTFLMPLLRDHTLQTPVPN